MKNKIALVTGASKGIGKAIALRLAQDGVEVIVNYATDKAGAEGVVQQIIKSGGTAKALQGDVSIIAGIQKMFSGIDKLDILVNNAGVFPMGGLTDATEEIFDKIFDVNVKGLFFTTQEAAKRMADNGRIVNISTVLARIATTSMGVYAASKGAVDIMTRDFAKLLGSRGITVNAVRPAFTKTEGTSGMVANKELVEGFVKDTALGRVAEPKDIADVVAFLCSDDARWVTAQIIEASGGYHF